ncbi:MAG: U32 family peptidase, partial [Alphaproteobacteria bacterium]|nr:U32 family peptidase [Alphaproteobacteria bacterium]
MKKELLAPAGDIEAGYAALYYGADAVYLGLKQFSARATANNFTEEELDEFTCFAHYLGRKVFVTINTVLQESEIPQLIKNLDICKRCKIDAIILQDLGVAKIVKEYYPEIEMHASTQMAVHNKQGALALKNLGFSRVVLARELSLDEIKDIATIKDLELETFVHGALCYSYSGVCQFSSFDNGRSANRGKCLYPCRAEFLKDDKREHCFSMKDMALEEDVINLPIYSLKIEGRKKNALYVAAVTDYYRNILDGNTNLKEKAQNIKQIFSRPWCKFHFRGKNKDVTDKKFVGHRGLYIGKVEDFNEKKIVLTTEFRIAKHDGIQIDIDGLEKPYGFSLQKFRVNQKNVWEAKAGEKVEISLPQKLEKIKKGCAVYLSSSSYVKGAYGYQKPRPKEFVQRTKIDVEVKILENKIIAKSCGKIAETEGVFTSAKDINKVNEAIHNAFAKVGDTVFELGEIKIENLKNLFVPISMLNDLRRKLYEQIVIEDDNVVLSDIEPRVWPKKQGWIVKVDDIKKTSLLDFDMLDEVILLISPQTKISDVMKLPKNKVRIALPTVCRKPKDFEEIIAKLIDGGFKKWEIGNYWGLSVLPLKKIDLSFDNMIYMFNTQAVQMAKDMHISRVTLAVEDTLSNMENLALNSPLPVVLVIYQDVVLFTSAVCIRDNLCKDCSQKPLWLSLEKDGQKYEALSKDCQLMMFNQKSFCIAKEAKNIKADFYRVDFVYKNYSPE